jgi:hypothetical protein
MSRIDDEMGSSIQRTAVLPSLHQRTLVLYYRRDQWVGCSLRAARRPAVSGTIAAVVVKSKLQMAGVAGFGPAEE